MRERIIKFCSGLFAMSFIAPILVSSPAYAAVAPISVLCPTIVQDNQNENEVAIPNTDICDLSVDKQVRVNGGVYVDADTADAAANAHLGDTLTWKITVTNQTTGMLTPRGAVYVQDVLPSGVNLVSTSATAGSYLTSGLFANNWYLPLQQVSDDISATTLPATLTITTTATTLGLAQNTATLIKYDQGYCDGGCVYLDADNSNDTNDAFVNIVQTPQVLGDSTTTPAVLGETGQTALSQAWLLTGSVLSSASIAVLVGGRRRKLQ